MAAAAQQVALQGVAAASILPAQLQPAVLTVIAFHMVVSVHGHHTDGGLTALCREDRTGTGGTLWCKNRVVISDTVDVVLHVHSEGYPVQALVAHRAPEAAWVVGLPKGLKDLGVRGTEGSVQVEGSALPPENTLALSLWQVDNR